jgi:hypothetical protein
MYARHKAITRLENCFRGMLSSYRLEAKRQGDELAGGNY